ncbi:MAG: hypothetical protein M9894_04995 [Planctomycetes bacterium]|nr:hypothetical protein [Planctomycetota bacterium]
MSRRASVAGVPRRRRGVALADFVTGMLLLAGALGAFASITRAKFDAIAAGDQHARAVAAAEEAVDRVRLEGLPRLPHGDADPEGFRLVGAFVPSAGHGLARPEGRVEARGLRLSAGDARGLFEVRVVVTWQDAPGRRARVRLSTVAAAPAWEERR